MTHSPAVQTAADAQAFLEANFAPWVLALDLNVTAISAKGATLTMPITTAISRIGGMVAGQALAAMSDTAMVLACGGHFGEMRPVATTNLDTQFLRPGVGDIMRCEAEIIRAGKALVFTRATMIAQPSEKLIATASATFFCV